MARKQQTESKRPIESYEHRDKQRLNNPPVGLVTPDTDPDAGQKKKTYGWIVSDFGLNDAIESGLVKTPLWRCATTPCPTPRPTSRGSTTSTTTRT
ncbi:MAG: hypothetical protein KatS3mg061_2330 [Dehalococcoidia bacterium]|nr:MAG: hypothetical protein KatS3mg061_2330 [Dehalococcoidia bacterium]